LDEEYRLMVSEEWREGEFLDLRYRNFITGAGENYDWELHNVYSDIIMIVKSRKIR
jgi:hypothetical protein